MFEVIRCLKDMKYNIKILELPSQNEGGKTDCF